MSKKISSKDLPKRNIKKIILLVVFALIIIGTIIGIVLYNKNKKEDVPDKDVYVTVGDTSLTQTEYVFYYTMIVNNYINNYSDYLDYIGLDTSKDFSTQYYDEDKQITWQDYFLDMTNSLIQTTMSLYNEAKEAKYDIRNDNFYDNFIKGLKQVAKQQDYTYEQYLKHIFIDTMTPTVLEKELNIYSIALNYSEYLKDQYAQKVTDKEINDLYAQEPDYFDSVTYHVFSIKYSTDVTADDESNDILTYDTAYERAQNVANATSEENFNELAVENALESTKDDYKKDGSTLVTTNSKSSLYTIFQDWMYDSSRTFCNTTIIPDETNSTLYVLFFVKRELNNDNSVDFRHILLTTETYSNEDDLEVAAKALYQKWKNAGATEKDFIEYANQYSEDTSENGLYKNSMNGDLLKDIDTWLFDQSRQKGDYTLLKTDVGYHMLYYIGQDEPYWKASARESIGDGKYDDYIDSIVDNNQLTFKNGTTYNLKDSKINNDSTESSDLIDDASVSTDEK